MMQSQFFNLKPTVCQIDRHKIENLSTPSLSKPTPPLLQGVKSPHNQDLFNACVSELVMESREFEMLLGRIQPDGSRKPGCIDKFQRDTSETIGFVAGEAEAKGLYEDAVRLYDLAMVKQTCTCV